MLSNSKKSRSGSQAQQLEYKNVFSFEQVTEVFNENDILPHQSHHGATVKKALLTMTSNILKDKKITVSTAKDEIGDEYAVVQKHLSVFLNEILVIADIIICGGGSTAMSSSSADLPQSKVKIEREWAYRIDNSAKTPLSSIAYQANSSGDVEGGNSDFSVVHDRISIALTLFEAKKTQINLIDLSKAEGKRAITQGAYQMVGDIQRLAKFIGRVTSYSSLLTNGLAWLHLRRIERLDGVFIWIHSSPISVVEKKGRGKAKVNEAGIDIVVQNILYALVTAKNIFEAITDTFASKHKVDIHHGEVSSNFYFVGFYLQNLLIIGL